MQMNFNKDRLSSIGRVDAVELCGSYREMGWQYGHALKDKINAFYDLAVNRLFIKEFQMPYENIAGISHLVFRQFPHRFKDMVRGIGEGSGLGTEKASILQQMTVLSEFAERKGCSNMVVWGDHAKDRVLTWGRTFDMPKFYRMFAEYLTVITCRPGDSSISATAIVYAGQIDAYTVMNDRGIFISVDEAVISAGPDFAHDRTPVSIIPLSVALDYSCIESATSALNTIRPGWPVIITAGDKDGAVSFEYSTVDCKRTEPFTPGVLVATNHFVNPAWGIGDPSTDKGYTITRRKNLLGAANKHRGVFDHTAMQTTLDTPVLDGGVFRPETAYAVVAIPAEQKMHLKVHDHQDWVEIDASATEPIPQTA
jgi:hypothetical protein